MPKTLLLLGGGLLGIADLATLAMSMHGRCGVEPLVSSDQRNTLLESVIFFTSLEAQDETKTQIHGEPLEPAGAA